MNIIQKLRKNDDGFTAVEVVIACVIFPIIVIAISNAFDSVRRTYTLGKQFNEIYAVLSACPELDRALEFTALSNTSNCYPNNTVEAEGRSGNIISYSPNLQVDDTSSLPVTDPLRVVPDSKVISIDVKYPRSDTPPLKLRILITRNGIGQL